MSTLSGTEHGGDIAVGEAKDQFMVGLKSIYTGMTREIRKLLDEWK